MGELGFIDRDKGSYVISFEDAQKMVLKLLTTEVARTLIRENKHRPKNKFLEAYFYARQYLMVRRAGEVLGNPGLWGMDMGGMKQLFIYFCSTGD
jgi:hypothetical protein